MEHNFTKLPRLYINHNFNCNIDLDKSQSNYLINVMRFKENDKIRIFNGLKGEFLAKIIEANSKRSVLQIEEKIRNQINCSEIWLVFSPLKNHRTDFIIEKATELGISKFIPVIFDRSIVKDINIDKARSNIIQAAEQSERLNLPEITQIINLDNFISSLVPGQKLIYMYEQEQQNSLLSLKNSKISSPIIIVIGPEGGLTIREIRILSEVGEGVHLGPRILRADTAALVSITLVQSFLGDLNNTPRF